MTDSLRVVIADDDDAFRDDFAQLLAMQEGFEVVAVVENGAEAISACSQGHIDMVLLDVDMPVLDGIAAAATIKKKSPQVTIVMLTAFAHEDSLDEALAAGVRAFLTKDIEVRHLATLLREAHEGKMIMGNRPTELLTEQYLEKRLKQQEYEDFRQDVAELPERLLPVFHLVIQAKPNKVIAEELFLSESSVRTYVSQILELTNCATRGELTLRALRSGIAD